MGKIKNIYKWAKKNGVKITNEGIKGNKNPNWRGGVSEYPNQREMMRIKILKIKENNGKCEACSEHADYIHHIDKSKSNHTPENLMLICRSCHAILHRGDRSEIRTTKWKRYFGKSINEIAGLLKITPSRVRYEILTNGAEALKNKLS